MIYPVTTLFAAAPRGRPTRSRASARTARPPRLDVPAFDAFTDMIGLPEMRELEARFAAD